MNLHMYPVCDRPGCFSHAENLLFVRVTMMAMSRPEVKQFFKEPLGWLVEFIPKFYTKSSSNADVLAAVVTML